MVHPPGNMIELKEITDITTLMRWREEVIQYVFGLPLAQSSSPPTVSITRRTLPAMDTWL